MRTYITLSSLAISAILTGCSSSPQYISTNPNLYKNEPNILNKETPITVSNDTKVVLPKGSFVKTDNDTTVDAILEESIKIEIPLNNLPSNHIVKEEPATISKDGTTVIKPPSVVITIPKNTQVILPPNTYLSMPDPTSVKVEKETEAVLPKGTEITIAKINWYAILFYVVLGLGAVWYYMSGRWQDKDGDGYDDSTQKPSQPVIQVQAQTYTNSSTSASTVAESVVNSNQSSNGSGNA